MTTPAQIEAFIRSIRPPGGDWYGKCAGLTYRTINGCGGHSPDIYGSAWLAYRDTTIESLDPSKAPPGAIHYWDYTDGAGNRYGHVTIDILGKGTDTLSATHYAHEYWATSAGLISVAAQTARGMPYLGWSRTYGRRNRLTITTGSTSGGGTSPLPTGDDDMPLTNAEKEEIASLAAAAVWASAVGRDAARVTTLQMLTDARAEATAAHKAIDDHAAEYTSDWLHANGAVTPPRPAGRLRGFIDRIVAAVEKPAAAPTVDVDALASAIVKKLPAASAGATPEQVKIALVEVLSGTVFRATADSDA